LTKQAENESKSQNKSLQQSESV